MPFFFIASVMMSPLNHLFLDLAGVMDFSYEAPETETAERLCSDPSSVMTKVGQSRRVQASWEVF